MEKGKRVWTFHSPPLIIFPVKKIFIILTLLFSMLVSLSAETVFWSGENEGNSAYSDKYTVSSVISVTYNDVSINVTVKGPLPETLPGRDLALSRTSLEALGIWGYSDTTAVTEIVAGARADYREETEEKEKSGWYSITLKPYQMGYALEKYNTLIFYGFKPVVEIKGNAVIYTIPYTAEYEKEEKINLLKETGFTIERIEETEDPYLLEKTCWTT